MIEIIPAIDIIEGRAVRLSQGDYERKKVYNENPVEVAKSFEGIGITRLHVVDLDGAKAHEPQNLRIVERIASSTQLTIQFGGGIKSSDSLTSAFNAGVSYAIGGSIAVSEPQIFSEWINKYRDRIILGADIRDGALATNGWMQSSSVTIEQTIDRFLADGLQRVICTDISKDGMLQGVDTKLYKGLQDGYTDLEIVVSGGISSLQDIEQLDSLSLKAVIVGKAIYEGRITLKELERWLLRG